MAHGSFPDTLVLTRYFLQQQPFATQQVLGLQFRQSQSMLQELCLEPRCTGLPGLPGLPELMVELLSS